MQNSLIEALADCLPQVLWRYKWKEYQEKYGVPFARGSLENMDCEGRGPKFGRMAGRVFYLKDDFLNWLATLDQEKGRA
ncbi:hypothetical protein [Oceanidesulfovibrio marinus]|uniref:DNA-binding protein n=1 Tax=Oceanidesulfovibrio marinus TaxID=370038 RepID=A0A6P1ZEF2_9BACT|nr:hypothetical protein [Oceanidesulfovibrio marinus]TVM32127.1 hypothetical protein DQK91_16490 [Oceanidesulfovibrio marinus]